MKEDRIFKEALSQRGATHRLSAGFIDAAMLSVVAAERKRRRCRRLGAITAVAAIGAVTVWAVVRYCGDAIASAFGSVAAVVADSNGEAMSLGLMLLGTSALLLVADATLRRRVRHA